MDNYQEIFCKNIAHGKIPQDLIPLINPGGELSAEEAIEVYQKDYFARLSQALGETFQALWWVLGDEDFFSLTRQYLTQYPSHFYDLSDLSIAFPEFVKGHRLSSEIVFLYDLVFFEKKFQELFHAPRENCEAVSFLSELTHIEEQIFSFKKHHYFFQCPFDVFKIWRHAQEDHDLNEEEIFKNSFYLMHKSCESGQVKILELNERSYQLAKNLSLGQCLNNAIEIESLVEEDVSIVFQLMSSERLILKSQLHESQLG